MGKRILFLVIVLSVSLFVSAQELTISEMLFLPQKYYVGDYVELRIVIRVPNDTEITVPENPPDEDWIDFNEIQILEHHEGAELRVVFRSFYPGTRTLPSINFGSFTLDKVKIHTSSILPETNSVFSQPRDQLYLPGTEAILVALVFLLLVIPLFSLFLAGKIKKWLIQFIATQKEKKPIRRFYRHLDELKKQAGRISSRDFYIELTQSLRKYLSIRSGKDYQTITTKEIKKQIKHHFPEILHLSDLVEVLRYSDEIKFSPRKSSYYKEIRDIELILRVVNAIEDKISGRKGKDSITLSNHDIEVEH